MARLRSHPALLIIDMQNGFCHASGSFGKLGLPVSRHASVIPAISRLKHAFQSAHLPIFYTEMSYASDYSDAGIIVDEIPGLGDVRGLIRGTWDAQVVDGLAIEPAKGDILVQKTRNTAFYHTEMDTLLKTRHVNQVVATGVGLNVCVESTVRDAWTYGYHALTVSDASASLSEEEQRASLVNLRHFGGSITVEEVLKELEMRAKGEGGGEGEGEGGKV